MTTKTPEQIEKHLDYARTALVFRNGQFAKNPCSRTHYYKRRAEAQVRRLTRRLAEARGEATP